MGELLTFFFILVIVFLFLVICALVWLFYVTKGLNDQGEPMEDDQWNNW